MGSLSSAEKSVIRDVIEYGTRGTESFGFNTGRALPLTLVLLGERDGCLFSVTEESEAEFLEETFSSAGLSFEQSNKNGIYRFFIAKSDSHLRRNTIGEGRPDGEFFGYPEDAIEFYCSSSDPVEEFEEFMRRSSYSFASWGDKTPLIEYIPAPSEESIIEALEREKQYEKALHSASIDLSDAHNYNF